MENKVIQPIWIDQDGTIWEYEAAWEQCEFNSKPSEEHSNNECINPREYIGRTRNDEWKNLCSEHFEEIKSKCKEMKLVVY
jgi:hypothetical protein